MAFLFLALVPSGCTKKEKSRCQGSAAIYVMKSEVMMAEKPISKPKKYV